MRMMTSARWAMVGVALALAPLAAACGDSNDSGGPITVTGKDYEFENLPSRVDSGTVLTLTNDSPRELHELVAVRLPDNEQRSADELVKLPQAEVEALFQGPPAMVLLAPPSGGAQIAAVGDGTLREPGRYLIICSIPTGADPNAYLSAAQNSGGGPPAVAGGPPHFVNGMYSEITVK